MLNTPLVGCFVLQELLHGKTSALPQLQFPKQGCEDRASSTLYKHLQTESVQPIRSIFRHMDHHVQLKVRAVEELKKINLHACCISLK